MTLSTVQPRSKRTPDSSDNPCDYSIHGVSRGCHVRAIYGIIGRLARAQRCALFALFVVVAARDQIQYRAIAKYNAGAKRPQ